MNRADKGAFWVTGGRCAHRKSPRMGRTQRLKNEKWPWKPPPTNLSYVRLAAIRALLMGVPRAQVCRLYHRRDRLIRLWIERSNRGGIDRCAGQQAPHGPAAQSALATLAGPLGPGAGGPFESGPTALDRRQAPGLARKASWP
jgi:hypothetical protein